MNEHVRWVTKAEAAEELEVSLSTLDRMIRKGEVEVSRERRRVYVRMEGPAYPSDEELLRSSVARERELERTVQRLERSKSELQERVSELERQRDEARESVSASRQAYAELEETYRKGQAARSGTRRLAFRLGLVIAALLVVVGLLTWRLVA